MHSCVETYVSQCLYGFFCLRLCFSVFVWTLVLALALLSICVDCCLCAFLSLCIYGLLFFAYVSHSMYGLLCLRFRFSVFVWTLVSALVLRSLCMDGCVCASVFSVFVWTLVLCLRFPGFCMDCCSCGCVSQCLYGLLCLCFSVFVWTFLFALAFLSVCIHSWAKKYCERVTHPLQLAMFCSRHRCVASCKQNCPTEP